MCAPGGPLEIRKRRRSLAAPEPVLPAERERAREPRFVANLVEHLDRRVDLAQDILPLDPGLRGPERAQISERDACVRRDRALARRLSLADCLGKHRVRSLQLALFSQCSTERR